MQPAAQWWSYLREALTEYALDAGDGELPRDHFLNWLADWGREAHLGQTSLLLTAHWAKGLEFDRVAVLDGDWLRSGANEDADATRRLYNVAMTRARKTLVLARFDRGQAWLDALAGRRCTCCPSRRPAPRRTHWPSRVASRCRCQRRHWNWRAAIGDLTGDRSTSTLPRAIPRPRHSPGTCRTGGGQPERPSPNIGRRLATV
ncbi:3'-5' exonuclease [Accumulibacter sp.]|uniref:3'-5' exonuclease n=1 Tax=Accumulibacter sp. TaxID=2053492 RepID=UPI0026021120|nr:3'-5' exonuclease [Accumulibacter sp.]